MGANDQGADATQNRWLAIPRTLCFVFNDNNILLMKRAPTRRIFPNRYNGLGGHVERGEEPLQGVIREVKEESGLSVYNVHLRGIHHIDAGQDTGIMMYIFTAWSDGRAVMGDEREGTLHWIPRDDVLKLDLVEDLPLVLPRLLDDKTSMWFAHVSYDDHDNIQIRFNDA